MTEIDIDMPEAGDVVRACRRIEQVMAGHNLDLASRGTLKKHPGCIHWHWRRAGEPGTLEITLWPRKGRVWLKVHPRRWVPWMDELIPRLRRALEA